MPDISGTTKSSVAPAKNVTWDIVLMSARASAAVIVMLGKVLSNFASEG